jgi:hypothetical protein
MIRSFLKLLRRTRHLKAVKNSTSVNNLSVASPASITKMQSKSMGGNLNKLDLSPPPSKANKVTSRRRFKLMKQTSSPLFKPKASLPTSTALLGNVGKKNLRSFSMFNHHTHATAAAAAVTANSSASANTSSSAVCKSLSSSIYSASDLNGAECLRHQQSQTSSHRQSDSMRMSRLSSKELSWYRLEELDYYYKILGNL